MGLGIYQTVTAMTNKTNQTEQNDKITKVAFNATVWVSVAVLLALGGLTFWVYRGGL